MALRRIKDYPDRQSFLNLKNNIKMSLDVYLIVPESQNNKQSSGIFIRREGQTVEVSESEFRELHPNQEPVKVVVNQCNENNGVYSANITHNFN